MLVTLHDPELRFTIGDVAESTLGLLLVPLPPVAKRNALVVPDPGASSTSTTELEEDLRDQPDRVPSKFPDCPPEPALLNLFAGKVSATIIVCENAVTDNTIINRVKKCLIVYALRFKMLFGFGYAKRYWWRSAEKIIGRKP
jgi:hypothetical protein